MAGTVAEGATDADAACKMCEAQEASVCNLEINPISDDEDLPFRSHCFVSLGPGTAGASWEQEVIGLTQTAATKEQFSYACAENLPVDEESRKSMTPSNKWVCNGSGTALQGTSGKDWQYLPELKQFREADAEIEAWRTSAQTILAGEYQDVLDEEGKAVVGEDGKTLQKFVYTNKDMESEYFDKFEELATLSQPAYAHAVRLTEVSEEIAKQIEEAEAELRTQFGIIYDDDTNKPVQDSNVGTPEQQKAAVAKMQEAITARRKYRAEQKKKREEIAEQHKTGWEETQRLYATWRETAGKGDGGDNGEPSGEKPQMTVNEDFVQGMSYDFLPEDGPEEEEKGVKLTPGNFRKQRAKWRKQLLAALAADLSDGTFRA